jgi:hypothetical protein
MGRPDCRTTERNVTSRPAVGPQVVTHRHVSVAQRGGEHILSLHRLQRPGPEGRQEE